MVKKKKNLLVQMEKKIKQLEEGWKRTAADFENYKKRQQVILKQTIEMANKELILKIVPILDNFQRAFSHIPINLRKEKWVEGIKQIEKQLEEILKQEGLEKIKTKQVMFDPRFHEAILYQSHPKFSEGQIIDEVEGGYLLADKVIKPAKVIVSKGRA